MITKRTFADNRLKRSVHSLLTYLFCRKHILILVLIVCSFQNVSFSQSHKSKENNTNRVIKGLITDIKNEAIIGASISIKGEKTGSVSDASGNFSLSVPVGKSAILVSFIGCETQEIILGEKDFYRIKLFEKSKDIDEVVVVGYATQRKATVTGSVASVKGDDVKKSPEANITNTLVGRMPGLIANNRSGEPGNDYSEILIRGKGTIGDTQPLFVIDGVANRYGGIDRLNSSDIESITILKDASAAIYGAQGANGVILVTTKRGVSSKPVITYEGSYGLSENTRTPKLMDAYQYMTYMDEIAAYEYPADKTQQKFLGIKEHYLDGTINTKIWGNTEWMSAVFQRSAPKTQHSISVRGGNDKVKYYVSGAFLYQEPCYKNTNFNFNTNQLRASIDANITNDLKVNVDISTREEIRNESNYSTGSLFWEAFNAYPYLHDYYDNGLPASGIAWGNNVAILAAGGTGYYKVNDNFINSKVGFDLKLPWITNGLYFNGYLALDKQFRNEKKLMGQWDAYTYDAVKDTYTDIYATTGDGNINLSQRIDSKSMSTVLMRLGYERRFKDHNINAFVAYEQSRDENNWFSAYRKNLPNTQVDYLFAGADADKTNNGASTIFARQNLFGRLSYAFKDKYLAEFTYRHDGSMNFAPGKRWGNFPGLSIGWRMSEEEFMKKYDFINELKVKASVGQLGNDRVSPFQYLTAFYLNPGAQLGVNTVRTNGFTVGTTPNTNITWEVSTNYNIGFESQFLHGMFSFDAQYFYSYRSNILIPRNASVPGYTGLTLPDENIGVIANQGIELEFAHHNKLGEFTYSIGGNFTFARNQIISIDEAADVPEWQKRTGYSIDSYLVYKSNGLFQTSTDVVSTKARLAGTQAGDIKYINYDATDNAITDRDKVRIHQSPTPEIVYGITMNGGWKEFELSVLLQGQALATTMIQPYTYNRDVDYFTNRWISNTETPNAKYPRAFSKNDPINSLPSDFWLNDASFIRLKNLQLSYNFKGEWLKTMKIQNLRVYFAGSNLLTFSKIKILDPETIDSGGLYYPQQRIYNFGVSLSL